LGAPRTTVQRALADRPTGFWFVLFLFVNLAFDLGGGTSASSRYATLAAMAEDHSFKINPYVEWTGDWARTPDGNFYSNKAPGPMLIGFPLYWVLDKVVTTGKPNREARDLARKKYKFTILKIMSFLLQVLPFFWLAAALTVWLRQENVSPGARHLSALLMLFGSTASLFLNSYFGHGMTAVFLLAMAYAWVRRRAFLVGLAFGAAVLCDYTTVLLAVPLIWILREERHRLSWGDFSLVGLGGLLPFIAFVGYHIACFGGPFTTAMNFLNPEFIDVPGGALHGIFHWLPNPRVMIELLFGGSRGLLWTNPWVWPLAVAMLLLWRRHTPWADANSASRTSLGNLAFGGLLALWLLNSAFGGWYGGHTVGPRYLAAVLPLFGPVLALAYDRMTSGTRALCWLGVLAAVLLNILIFLSNEVPSPGIALWPYYFEKLFLGPSLTALLRSALLVLAGAVAFGLFTRYWRKTGLGNEF
jgi:hypothetical protein